MQTQTRSSGEREAVQVSRLYRERVELFRAMLSKCASELCLQALLIGTFRF